MLEDGQVGRVQAIVTENKEVSGHMSKWLFG